MIWWNKDGFKFGICDDKPTHSDYSLLCLNNTTEMRSIFDFINNRFTALYKKKFYLHHY